MTGDRDIPDRTWNSYLKKYEKTYRVKHDENGVYNILCKYGNIQLYSYTHKKLCAVLEFRSTRAVSGFLSKTKGLTFKISQQGDTDIVIVFDEKDLSLFVKPCSVRIRKRFVITEARREQLREQLVQARKRKQRGILR